MIITILISGMVGMAAQIISLRQLTAIFQGNELTMGIMLAAWLWWTALGGWIGSRLKRGEIPTLGLVVMIQAACVPLAVFLIRSSRAILGIQSGQIVGLFPILTSALMTLLPVAVLTGFCFSLGCHVCRGILGSVADNKPIEVKWVYVAESAGAALGGLSSFFLAPIAGTIPWAFVIAGLGIGAGIWTCLKFSVAGRLLWGSMLIAGIVAAFSLGTQLETSTLAPLFAGQKIVAEKESPYGQLVGTKLSEQTTLYINGIKEANVPDPFAAEEVAHIPLALHPDPRNVILIGGVVGETPREILKHPSVTSLDLVELDPNLIRMAGSVLPDSITTILRNQKITIHTMDGRRLMTTSDREYDVVLVNLPDPLSAQINRFYTIEWFQMVRRHLTDRGVFSFSVHSSESSMNREQAAFLACIYRTLTQGFPYVTVLPGANARFLASRDSTVLQFDADTILRTLQARGVHTQYISSAYLPDILQPFRMQQLEDRIRQPHPEINRDFKPVGYYTGLVLWDTHFRTSLRPVFERLRNVPFGAVVMVLGISGLLLFGLSLFKRGRGETTLPLALRTAIVAVGASGIGMEILVIIAFQVIFGVAYGWVAVIVTAFMAGLAVGARLVPIARVSRMWFVLVQIAMAATPLALWLLISQSKGLVGHPAWVGGILFGVAGIVVGAIGGAQFPIAASLLMASSGGNRSSAQLGGGLYALDLLGSSLGAIVLSALIVPLWGLDNAFLILALINVIPLAFLFLLGFKRTVTWKT